MLALARALSFLIVAGCEALSLSCSHRVSTLARHQTPSSTSRTSGWATHSRKSTTSATLAPDCSNSPHPQTATSTATSYAAGARIHSNSWGSSQNTTEAQSVDQFIWKNAGTSSKVRVAFFLCVAVHVASITSRGGWGWRIANRA